jgi:asparagine synthetase B (glutamine-hydrolysing)
MKSVTFETDWLGTQPVFYNEQTRKAGYNIHDIIDYPDLELDPEGFNNYLDFGYSVFEQTPVKHVKFLRHSSRLQVDEQGKLTVERLPDPLEKFVSPQYSETEVLDMIQARVRAWECSCTGDIVIPTSGGYDSRLLNILISDKSRIRSFTYGISDNQADSHEVVYARTLSEKLGTRWQQIQLGEFHAYFDEWDRLFGPFTHAHGMYHIEFFRKVAALVDSGSPMLSGIVGDPWAGGASFIELRNPQDLVLMAWRHGLHADVRESRLKAEDGRRQTYWNAHIEMLRDPTFQVFSRVRLKMGLLSYLMSIPEELGFKPWSPFLDMDLAMTMMRLPAESRRKRLWQQRFFQQHGLDLESMQLEVSRRSTLELQALRCIPLKPLDDVLLGEVINPDYVRWVNGEVRKATGFWDALWKVMPRGSFGQALGRLGVRDRRVEAYGAYSTLKPIEYLLQRRDAAQHPAGSKTAPQR